MDRHDRKQAGLYAHVPGQYPPNPLNNTLFERGMAVPENNHIVNLIQARAALLHIQVLQNNLQRSLLIFSFPFSSFSSFSSFPFLFFLFPLPFGNE